MGGEKWCVGPGPSPVGYFEQAGLGDGGYLVSGNVGGLDGVGLRRELGVLR